MKDFFIYAHTFFNFFELFIFAVTVFQFFCELCIHTVPVFQIFGINSVQVSGGRVLLLLEHTNNCTTIRPVHATTANTQACTLASKSWRCDSHGSITLVCPGQHPRYPSAATERGRGWLTTRDNCATEPTELQQLHWHSLSLFEETNVILHICTARRYILVGSKMGACFFLSNYS